MNANVKYMLAAGTLGLTLSFAHAADTMAPATQTEGLTAPQARDLKTESKAEYEARKKVAEAQKELDVADCKTGDLGMKGERDCKHEAKEIYKDSKSEAKQIYKNEKADIKSMRK